SLAQILESKAAVARHAGGIVDTVMRHRYLARQIVFRNDDAGGPARGPRQRFPRVLPAADRTEIHCGEPLCLLAEPLWVDRLDLADAALRLERVAARSVARHPHHHLHEFVGIVSGLEDALQRVTADAAAYPVLLLFGSRHGHEPIR